MPLHPPASLAAEPALVIPFRPRVLGAALALTVLLVFVLGVAADQLARARGGPLPDGLARRLGFTDLVGLPRVVNGALLLAAAGSLAVNAALTPPAGPLRRRWALSAIVAAGLAAAEWARLHTTLTAALGLPPGAWLLAALPLAAALGLAWLPALRRLPPATRTWGALAAALYLAGVIGGALLGQRVLAASGPASRVYPVVAAAGEALELGALVLLLVTLWAYAAQTWGRVRFALRPPAPLLSVTLPPRRVALALGAGVLLLAGAYVVFYVVLVTQPAGGGLGRLLAPLNLDDEGTLTAAYNAFLLLSAAAVLSLISRHAFLARSSLALRWLTLAVAFVGLTADELLSFHEMLISPLQRLLGVSGLLSFAWVIPVLPLVAIFGLFCLQLVLTVPRRTGALLLLAGAVYVGGAAGIEMLGSLASQTLGRASLAYRLEVAVEEVLEMAGAVLFLYTLLDYLARGWGAVVLDLRGPAAASAAPDSPAAAPAAPAP